MAGLAALISACSGRGRIDLSKATPLTAEPVSLPPGASGGKPGGPNDTTQYAALFSGQPGQWFSPSVVGGLIDPVGTALNDDYDGDGIPNMVELQQNPLGQAYSNIWVADYPEIEADIAPPVTMKVEVLASSGQTESVINSDVTSDEVESRKNEGSEKFHQNELNDRTVQYERAVSQSSSNSSSNSTSTSSASASASATGSGGGNFLGEGKVNVEVTVDVTSKQESTNTHTFNQSSSERTQVFEDRPFKNNLDRSGFSVKADAAAKNARQYRDDKQTKTSGIKEIKPNGGQIRAAMFIKNHSVNMPVKISNILCSLLFETPQGVLIPMESFRLRNDDFSLFEVSVYGGAEFGPYVVTLNNLNTVEIENALALGYTPKIFIVDYEMRHVEDSNYRTALSSSFTGNNLKIIEENAKGRTALIKIIAPNVRKMFRVSAFEVQRSNVMASEGCNMSAYASNPEKSPGISLRRALERISCSGIPFEFEHYVLDFTGTSLEPTRPTVYMYGIKGINGLRNNVRCTDEAVGTLNLPAAITGDPGSVLTTSGQIRACKIRVAELTEDEIFNMGMWVVFDNGRYYKSSKYLLNSSLSNANPDNRIHLFSGTTLENCGTPRPDNATGQWCPTPIVQGIESRIWAGDNYDITYMKVSDLINRVRNFGTTPLETGASVSLNTLWDKSQVGEYPYYPGVRSTFLGQAGLKDKIEFKVKLDNTRYLNPSFGTGYTIGGVTKHEDFSYNLVPDSRTERNKLFPITEAVDIEISLALNGGYSDWKNIVRDMGSVTVDEDFKDCGRSWDFQKQEYTICVEMPAAITGVGSDGLVNLYMRTPLSNSYRATVWPVPKSEIKRFDARLISPVSKASATPVLKVYAVAGSLASGIAEQGKLLAISTNNIGTPQLGSETGAIISSITPDGPLYFITLNKSVAAEYTAGTQVTIPAHSFTGELVATVSPLSESANVLRIRPTGGTLPLGSVTGVVSVNLPYSGGSSSSSSSSSSTSASSASGGGPVFDTFEMKNVGRYDNTYSITLSSALQFDHKAGERVTADVDPATSGLDTPAVTLSYTGNFFNSINSSDWNQLNQRPFPYTKLYPLNQAFNCPRYDNGYQPGAYFATNCSGYQPSLLTGNWLGADNYTQGTGLTFSSSIANNWADPSVFMPAFSDEAKTPSLVTALSGEYFRMNQENLVFAAKNSNSYFGVYNGVDPLPLSGDRVLLVGTNNSQIINSKTGQPIVQSIAVGVGDLYSGFDGYSVTRNLAAATANTALIVYDGPGESDIKGRLINLSSGAFIGAELLISSANANFQYAPRVVVVGNQALVTWISNDEPVTPPFDINGFDIKGRVVNMTDGSFATSEFRVNTTRASDQMGIQMSVSGTRIVVSWMNYLTNNSDQAVFARVYDLGAGLTQIGSELNLTPYPSPDSSYRKRTSKIIVSGNRALVVWGGLHVYGRFIDLSTGTLAGATIPFSELGVNHTEPFPQAETNGDTGIVTWSGSGGQGLRGRVFNFITGETLGGEFRISNDTGLGHYPQVVVMGQRAFIAWGSELPGYPVQGRTIDLPSRKKVGDEISIGEPYAFIRNPSLAVSGDSVLVRFDGPGTRFHLFQKTLHHGLNNFFVAPLVEKSYTVTSRIRF